MLSMPRPWPLPPLPPAVYVMDQIVSMVGGSREAADTAANSILLRLKGRSATVKQKVAWCWTAGRGVVERGRARSRVQEVWGGGHACAGMRAGHVR